MDDHTDHEQPAAAEDERSLGRKLLRTGLGALLVSETVVREVVKELPAEAANRLMQGTKDTKNEVMRLAGNEVKNFLEHLDLVEDQDGNGASHGVSCRQQAASHGSLLLDLRLARPEVELVDGDHQRGDDVARVAGHPLHVAPCERFNLLRDGVA